MSSTIIIIFIAAHIIELCAAIFYLIYQHRKYKHVLQIKDDEIVILKSLTVNGIVSIK